MKEKNNLNRIQSQMEEQYKLVLNQQSQMDEMKKVMTMMQSQMEESAKLILSLQTKKIEEQLNLEAEVDLLLSDDVIGEQLICEKTEEKDEAEVEDITEDEIEEAEDKPEDEADEIEEDEADEVEDKPEDEADEVEEWNEWLTINKYPLVYKVSGYRRKMSGLYYVKRMYMGSPLYEHTLQDRKFTLKRDLAGWCITDTNAFMYWSSSTYSNLPEDEKNIFFSVVE
jgi:hypothetical protein